VSLDRGIQSEDTIPCFANGKSPERCSNHGGLLAVCGFRESFAAQGKGGRRDLENLGTKVGC
jgi:hypothetical protein